jgi:hypothetical protein
MKPSIANYSTLTVLLLLAVSACVVLFGASCKGVRGEKPVPVARVLK